MTDEDQPTGVAVELPGGDRIGLVLEKGPMDGCGCQLWLAYGPTGMVIPDGAEIVFDEPMPVGHGLAVAFEQHAETGQVRFASRPVLPVGDIPPPVAPGQGPN